MALRKITFHMQFFLSVWCEYSWVSWRLVINISKFWLNCRHDKFNKEPGRNLIVFQNAHMKLEHVQNTRWLHLNLQLCFVQLKFSGGKALKRDTFLAPNSTNCEQSFYRLSIFLTKFVEEPCVRLGGKGGFKKFKLINVKIVLNFCTLEINLKILRECPECCDKCKTEWKQREKLQNCPTRKIKTI